MKRVNRVPKSRLTAAGITLLLLLASGIVFIASLPTASANGAGSGGDFRSVSSGAFVNTVTGTGGSQKAFANGEIRRYHVLGVGGVPTSGVSAVVLNIRVPSTSATGGDGYLRAWGSDDPQPSTSNASFSNESIPTSNTAMIHVGSSGDISVFCSLGGTNLVLEIEGYVTTSSSDGGGFVSLSQKRVVDTRGGYGTPDSALQSNGYIDTQLSGSWGVPTGAPAVFANVTIVGPTADGYLKETLPSQSSTVNGGRIIHFTSGATRGTGIVLPIDSAGKARFYNPSQTSVHVVIDIQGYFTRDSSSGGGFTPLSKRLLDTRSGSTHLPAKSVVDVTVAGVAGVPSNNTGAVALNLAAVNTNASGYLRAWPTQGPEPVSIAASFSTGNNSSNLVFVQPGRDGNVSIANRSSQSLDVVVDLQGFWSQSATDVTQSPTALTGSVNSDQAVASVDVAAYQASDQTMPLEAGADAPGWQVPSDHVTLSGNNYAVKLDPRDIPQWAVTSDGLVTFEVSAFDANGEVIASITVSARAVFDSQGAATWAQVQEATTDPDASAAPPGLPTLDSGEAPSSTPADVQVDAPGPKAGPEDYESPSVTDGDDAVDEDSPTDLAVGVAYSRLAPTDTATCYPAQSIYLKSKTAYATIGTSYAIDGAVGSFSRSSSTSQALNLTLGAAFSATGVGGSFSQSSSSTLSTKNNTSWAPYGGSRAYKLQVRYILVKKRKKTCNYSSGPAKPYYKWVAANFTGPNAYKDGIDRPNFVYCPGGMSPYSTFTRDQSGRKSYTLDGGVKIAVVEGGLNVSRGYSSAARLSYKAGSTRVKLCGNNADPAYAGKVMLKHE